ncbi:MAG: hypothetical protein ABSF64_12425 [Bryobacteraceae bacterium]|jgi:hypothetical protein
MRKAWLVFILAGWLLAQTGSSSRILVDASANERLAKVELTLAALQLQVADVQKTQQDMQKTQQDMQRQLSDLNAKMSLVLWLGAAVGVLLLGAAWKSLERRESVAAVPAPAYAPYPPYTAPEFRQWEMETLVRRVVEELRRDAEARQPAKSTPA